MSTTDEMPFRGWPSPGRCIYCLNNAEPLHTEHMIPRSLDGAWQINQAACLSCQKLTNEAYENEALNSEMLRIPRQMLQMRRRNRGKKNRRPIRPVKVFAGDVVDATDVSDATILPLEWCHIPPIFAMLALPPARKFGVGTANTARVAFVHLKRKDASKEHVADITLRQEVPLPAFAKMLAKIAYCYAVAERKLEGFDGSEIRQLLCGERNDPLTFVGGTLRGEKLTKNRLHHIEIRNRDRLITVIVHLFSSYEAPAYEIVVGPAIGPTS